MGLNNNENSFVGMLYKLGIIQKNIFSLCFEHDGGYFSIGEIYDEFHYNNKNNESIQYVDLINKNSGNYVINLKYIKLGEEKINFNGKAIIDSGTTLTYFPKKKFEEIMNKILDKCKLSKKILPHIFYFLQKIHSHLLQVLPNHMPNALRLE